MLKNTRVSTKRVDHIFGVMAIMQYELSDKEINQLHEIINREQKYYTYDFREQVNHYRKIFHSELPEVLTIA